jgi:DNA replication protein DnaC
MADDHDRNDDDAADRELREKLERIEDPLEKIQAITDDAVARVAPTKEKVEEQEDKTDKAAERASRLASSGVKSAILPDDFDRLVRGTRADIFPTFAIKVAREWYESLKDGDYKRAKGYLVLYGQTGRGKTVAGAYVIAQMGGIYVEAEELREAMTGGRFTEKRRTLILESRFVMVDDLGTEENDDKAQRALFSFVNQRQGLKRGLTLITSNLALEKVVENGIERSDKAFKTRYDDRIIGRLYHAGRFVEAVGPDLRRRDC